VSELLGVIVDSRAVEEKFEIRLDVR